jgi:purine-binding chemotaxis protein CheW
VTGIAAFSEEQITPVPALSSKIRMEFLRGLARSENELMVVLDIDRLLSEEELALVEAHGSAQRAAGAD